MRLKLFAMIIGLPLLGLVFGCSVHSPQQATLPTPVPSAYVERSAAPDPASLVERWWERFGEPELDELMTEAFAANPDLRQAFARLEQAEAVVRTTGAAQRPSFDLNAAGGRRRQTAGSLGAVTEDTYSLSLPASFEIDLWRKLASRTEAARLDAAASREEVKALYLSLSAQVADLYFLALEQRAQLALTDSNIAAFADTLERVERRYREGLVPALDVYQSRQNLASARSRRPQFENGLAAAEHALSVVLGQYPGRGVAEGDLPAAIPEFPAGVPSLLLSRRPDIEADLLRLKASDARIAAAIADRFPALRLTGSYGGQSEVLGDLLGSGNILWNLLLNIAQPLYDGGRRAAEVDRTRAVFRENLAGYHQSVLTAFREVEDALAAGRTGEERIARLAEREEASASALRLSLDRYLQGLSDYLPVLTAQGLHFNAQSELLAARRQLIADRITLARSLGGAWMEAELTNNNHRASFDQGP
ncbi:MAG: efflux transporter outer membrane subunit [Syntrophotaleaceae bacterium]